MQYITFSGQAQSAYPICILSNVLRSNDLQREYVSVLGQQGIKAEKVIAYGNPQHKKKADRLEYYGSLLPILASLNVKYLIVSNADTLKDLTGTAAKVDSLFGYVLPCTHPLGAGIQVVYVPSTGMLFHHPEHRSRVKQSLDALVDHARGQYKEPGAAIIHFSAYPETVEEIKWWLEKLIQEDRPLAVDIEAFNLKHYNSGIGTIAFAWSEHEGIAFRVDIYRDPAEAQQIRMLLADFFIRSQSKKIYHKIAFDAYILIYQLYMENILDGHGRLRGLEIMLKDWECTLLISYLATNSCAGNQLSLKSQGQEFSGSYSVDVEDITKVPIADLLEYNLIDALTTWFVYKKNYPKMVADQQLDIYTNLIKPSTWDIIQMQLSGMPLNMEMVKEGKAEMLKDQQDAVNRIMSSPITVQFQLEQAQKWADAKNLVLKKKRVTAADYKGTFNLNSPDQLQHFLYTHLNLPVIDRSKTNQPSTKRAHIEKLKHHTIDQQVKDLLDALVDYKFVEKILTAFIPAFEAAPMGPDGNHYLFGFFNIGGTVSGRLSASDVNLQQLPATGSRYAKTVKKMFSAPRGWLFVGIDYESLEDRISALTTKDPNKLKVYTDGYDGHSLRAFNYFRDLLPDIEDTVESINSMAVKGNKYEHIRQDSKAPTFALTYQGTYQTLMKNLGWDEAKAKSVEANYHALYAVSDQWVQDKLVEASRTGYVTVAFGLRIRTPLLAQCVIGARSTPKEAAAEGRTAGNALGQSYGLLNTRAMMAFMKRVRSSIHRLSIHPVAQIHDAQYYLVRNDLSVLAWMNEYLIPEIKWQNLPEIEHDQVKLGGSLGVFYPSWAKEMAIPNGAGAEEIRALSIKHLEKLNEPEKRAT